jgi:hypothetical protein
MASEGYDERGCGELGLRRARGMANEGYGEHEPADHCKAASAIDVERRTACTAGSKPPRHPTRDKQRVRGTAHTRAGVRDGPARTRHGAQSAATTTASDDDG